MPRKITRKGVVRKLDKLVSEIVIKRDGRCIVCGSTKNLTCGHLFSRIAYSTRWELGKNIVGYLWPSNCYAQCLSCNLRHEYDPYPMMSKVIGTYGQKLVDDLHREYVTPRKFKTYELVELYEKLSKNIE